MLLSKVDNCQRCNSKMKCSSMSYMNEDIVCAQCKSEERNHPRYKEAKDAEREAVKAGNMNYPGLFAGIRYKDIE